MKLTFIYIISNLVPILVLAQRPRPPPPPPPPFILSLEECRNEIKVTQDEFFHVMWHDIPKTSAEECLLACTQKKMGFMAADNTMNLNKILESISAMKNFNSNRYEKLKKMYEDCKASEIEEKDQCKAAKNVAECVYPKEKTILPPRPQASFRPPTFNKNVEECKKTTDATDDEIRNVMRREIPKTKKEECMMACMQKKIGIFGQDNKIDLKNVENRFGMMKGRNPILYNRTIQMYIDCKEIETTEKDECIAAKKYAECLFPKEKMNQLPPVMRKNVQECQNKTEATEMDIYNSMYMLKIPKTKGESCILACMQKKSGAMNVDNTMAINKVTNNFRNMRFYSEDLYNKTMTILYDCKALETKEADECVAAQKFAECVIPKQNTLREAELPPMLMP